MPKMIVSIDGVVIKEVQLTKDRTTLGRRPYNDIVIDNLAVSGEHAVLQMIGQRGLPRGPEQHQRHLRQRQGREEAVVAEQRHGRDRQVQDQVHQRGAGADVREDHDHEGGLGAASRRRRRLALRARPGSAALGHAGRARHRRRPASRCCPAPRPAARCRWSRWSPPSASRASRWRRSPSGPRLRGGARGRLQQADAQRPPIGRRAGAP